jgi:FkbM family methyltransferase
MNYRRGTASLADLGRLLRVRLSLTPAGRALAPRGGEGIVNLRGVGPVIVRNGTSDVFVVSELLDGDSYDGLLSHAPAEVGLVLDLGANTGIVTRWLLARFPHAQVIAVEPDPETCAVLRRNLATQARATVVEAGVGGSSGRASMSGTSGAIGRRIDPAETGSIEVLTVPDVLARAGIGEATAIDIVKCDVEGAERGLFETCADWIGRVRALAVETHDGYTIAEVVADIAAAGSLFETREHVAYAEFRTEVGILVRPEPPPARS